MHNAILHSDKYNEENRWGDEKWLESAGDFQISGQRRLTWVSTEARPESLGAEHLRQKWFQIQKLQAGMSWELGMFEEKRR